MATENIKPSRNIKFVSHRLMFSRDYRRAWTWKQWVYMDVPMQRKPNG